MIQTLIDDLTGGFVQNKIYLDLYDKMTNTDYRPLIYFESQLTGNIKKFTVNRDFTNKERYVEITYNTTRFIGQESLTGGNIQMGTTDFPLGFYNTSIYQNSSNTNLDSSGLVLLYSGLMNMAMNSGEDLPVEYTEYTTNDSDTESVYITI